MYNKEKKPAPFYSSLLPLHLMLQELLQNYKEKKQVKRLHFFEVENKSWREWYFTWKSSNRDLKRTPFQTLFPFISHFNRYSLFEPLKENTCNILLFSKIIQLLITKNQKKNSFLLLNIILFYKFKQLIYLQSSVQKILLMVFLKVLEFAKTKKENCSRLPQQ